MMFGMTFPPRIATRWDNFCPILLYMYFISELDSSRERPIPALEPEVRLGPASSVVGLPYGTLDRPRAFMTDERSIRCMKVIGSSEVDEAVSRLLERWADYND